MVFLLQTCSNSQDKGQEYVFIFFCMVFECCGFAVSWYLDVYFIGQFFEEKKSGARYNIYLSFLFIRC